jgi:hypothetical protein
MERLRIETKAADVEVGKSWNDPSGVGIGMGLSGVEVMADLTPDQARQLAARLVEEADRIAPNVRGLLNAEARAEYVYKVDEAGRILSVEKAKDPSMAQPPGEAFQARVPGSVADADGNIWLSHDTKASKGRLRVSGKQAAIAIDPANGWGWRIVGRTGFIRDGQFAPSVEIERD